MAITLQTIASSLGAKLIKDEMTTTPASGQTAAIAPKTSNATAGTGSILYTQIVNPNSHAIWLHAIDATSATVGTSVSAFKWKVAANTTLSMNFAEVNGQTGMAFTAGLTYWILKDADYTTTVGPDSTVTVYFLTT